MSPLSVRFLSVRLARGLAGTAARPFSTAASTWNAATYMSYGSMRTRPAVDLLRAVLNHVEVEPKRIADMGCGPGNSTRLLCDEFPEAIIDAVDIAPDMMEVAPGPHPHPASPAVGCVRRQVLTYGLCAGTHG